MARWKDVDGYEGVYLVSDDGRFVSLPRSYKSGNKEVHRKSARELKTFLRGRGDLMYEGVALSKDGNTKFYAVHRLVAMAFVDNPNGYDVVNHIDRNPLNNHYTNLEWCDQQYNNEYSHNKPVIQILDGEVVASYKSATYASKMTGISRRNICNVLNGRTRTAGGYHWKYTERSVDLSHYRESC